MPLPAGRPPGPFKRPIQIRVTAEEAAIIDAIAAHLSQLAFGAHVSRAEAVKLAALSWAQSLAYTKETSK